jgi:hypothetical protein
MLFVDPGPFGVKFAHSPTIIDGYLILTTALFVMSTVALRIELSIIDRDRVFLCCHTMATRGNKEFLRL